MSKTTLKDIDKAKEALEMKFTDPQESERYIELRKLRELFQYTYEVEDTYHTIDDILRGIPQPTLGLFIDLLQAYKKNLIEDTFKAYPMNIDALNCRNGSMTVIGDLIKLLTHYKKRTIDMEFRDDGKLRADLEKANEKLKENPIDIVTADVQMWADGKRYRKDSLGNFSIPLNN